MSDETTKQRICLERKDEILRHLVAAKGLIEMSYSSNPNTTEEWVAQLGAIRQEVSDSYWADFQAGLSL